MKLRIGRGEIDQVIGVRENGAEAVAVADLDYVFSKDNPLYATLEAGLS